MNKALVLLALLSTTLPASPTLAAESCQASTEGSGATKVLQAAVGAHQDVKQEMGELQSLIASFGAASSEKSASDVAEQILARVSDVKEHLQTALSQLDNTQDFPLIVAQAQARMTAALGKFRGFKNLDLDASKREKISCLEQHLKELNQRLQEMAKVPL